MTSASPWWTPKQPAAKSGLQPLAESFTALRTIVTTGLLGILLALAIYGLISELSRKDVMIEPISVPEILQKAGWTKEVAARRLQDRIALLSDQSMTDKAPPSIASDAARIDFTVPGTTFTARTLVEFLREFLGFPARKIGGELILADSVPKPDAIPAALRTSFQASKPNPARVRMAIRTNLGTAERVVSKEGSVDEVLDAAAIEILQDLDPYTAASYFAFKRRDLKEALAMVYRMLGRPKDGVEPIPGQPHRPSRPVGLDRAYLMWAYILVESGRPDQALEKFQQADKAHREADPLSQGWAPALDGHGVLLMGQNKLREAREKFIFVTTRVDPGYASSWYNLGRTHLNEQDVCKALAAFAAATRLDPKSAIAWEGWGTALLKQVGLVRYDQKPNEPCLKGRTIRQLEAEAETMYAKAIGADPGHGPAWAQWGIMEFQKGEAAFWAGASAKEPDEQRRLFDEGGRHLQDAVGKLTTALAANPKDEDVLGKLARIADLTDQR